MEKFTASNGVEVEFAGDRIEVGCSAARTGHSLTVAETEAAREFFRAERDEELGRWRFPANPDYVVYPPDVDDEEQVILILFEPGGGSGRYTREWLTGVINPEGWAVAACAKAYFEAHPERKPWEDAKPGEVWVLTLMGDEIAYQCTSSLAGHVYFDGVNDTIELNSTMITAARRIWPEVSDD